MQPPQAWAQRHPQGQESQGAGREKELGPGKAGPALDLEPGALGSGPSSVSETLGQYFFCTWGTFMEHLRPTRLCAGPHNIQFPVACSLLLPQMGALRLREVKSLAQGHSTMEPGLDRGPDGPMSLPILMIQAGREVPCRVSYLLRQGPETQEPVLSLLQGSGELIVAKLQVQGRLGDLTQVTGAQLVQVLVQVGGGGPLLDTAQGLAVRDRWDVPDEQEPGAYPGPGTYMHEHTW